MDARIQQRRAWFWFGLLAACVSLFIIFPWPVALTILILLAIFLSGAITALWKAIHQQPVQTPVYQPPQMEEEPLYEQGYPAQVVQYQPLGNSVPKEEPFNEDAPQVQYPQQYR